MAMEQLTEDAVAAWKEGLTYGQYIAKFKPPEPPAERYPKKKAQAAKAKTELIGIQTNICEYCGCEYIAEDRRKRSACSAQCRRLLQARRAKEKYYRDRETPGGHPSGCP